MTGKIYPEKFSLRNKIAVVTGGVGLIGKAISTGFAQAGAKVYIADIEKKEGKKFVKNNPNFRWVDLDITNIGSIKKCISLIIKDEKKIDVWVNCAYPKTIDWDKKFEKIKYESWKKNVDMHLNGYFLCCQQIAEHMKKQKSGSIINLSSIYGIVGPNFSIYEKDATMPAAYSAIKGGLNTFTKYLSTYYGKYGVRVNAICPGGIYNNQPKTFLKKYSEKTPIGRMAEAKEIAGPAIFLASDASSYVTGHILIVDGGWTAW